VKFFEDFTARTNGCVFLIGIGQLPGTGLLNSEAKLDLRLPAVCLIAKKNLGPTWVQILPN